MSASPLPSVQRKLNELRARIRRWFLVDGLGKLCLSLVGLVFVDFWIDRLFRMDKSQRAVMLLIMVGIAAYLIWRHLLRPLRVRLSDRALLLQVETQNPDLKEGLISAWELSEQTPENASPGLVAAAIDQGSAEADKVDFDEILDRKRHTRNLGFLIVGAIALAAIAISTFATKPMGIWANRNLFLGNASWPQDYYLQVTGAKDGTLTVPRGEDWPVLVNVERVIGTPDSLKVEFEGKGGTRSEVMNRLDKLRFEATLRDVQEAYSFRVTGRKASTPWITIRLVERPEVASIELIASPPDYTGLEPAPFPPGSGPYYILKGTGLEINGTSDMGIDGAELVHGDERFALSVTDEVNFSGQVEPDRLSPGVYTLSLLGRERVTRPGDTEAQALRSSDSAQFTLRDKEDKIPKVKAATMGIGNLVVEAARIPYKVKGSDDFAITALDLHAEWSTEDGPESSATNGQYQVSPESLSTQFGQDEVTCEDALELSAINAPEGARITIDWRASDNDTISGPKLGKSQQITLRVVSSAELREDILRREKEVRERFETGRKKQLAVGTDLQALKVDVGESITMSDRQRLDLNRAQKEQKLLGTQIGQQAERLIQIQQELLNNRLEAEENSNMVRMRSEIIEPMQLLAGTTIPTAANAIDALRRLDDPTTRQVGFEQCIERHEAIVKTMDSILKFMVKNEDFQLAVNLLHEIKKAQEGVKRMTMAEKDRRIRELIDEQKREESRSN